MTPTALWDRIKVLPEWRHVRRALVLLIVAPALLVGGEAFVRAWLRPIPSEEGTVRVYARPLTLTRGEVPDRAKVEDRLQRLGYQRTRGQDVGIGEYYFGSRGWVIGRRPFRGPTEPMPPGFAIVRLDYSGRVSRLEDDTGRTLPGFALEPELIGRIAEGSMEDRLPVSLEEVPEKLIDALLTVEDQRFFQHNGLDFRRIGAAFMANLKAGRVVQGGSTLTQQLAKNLYLSPKRSLIRKVREATMAVTLEGRYGKEAILQAYLNHVYLGQDGAVAIHGVGRAAQFFFGKDVTVLDLPEAALLVALIRAPSLYSPFRNPGTAVTRRNLVLRLMLDAGSILEPDYQAAVEAPLNLRKSAPPPRSSRYFVDYVAGALNDRRSGATGEGMRAIMTTLDTDLQRAAEGAVGGGLARLERRFDWLREEEAGEPLQAALVALDPRTGEILAMVGGRDYGASQFNRAVHARRQPGSAFKPIVALAALARASEGMDAGSDGRPPPFTLASVLEDRPFRLETPVGLWEPVNYDRSYSGPVTLRDALEKSLNVPFARLGVALGPDKIVETAGALGIESPLRAFPSIALGASEVSPLELTRAFGVLAAGGFRPELKSLHSNATKGYQVFHSAEAYLVTSALRGVVARGTGQGLRDEGFYGDVAAKSGTTNDYRDGWFVAYTPSLAVGVWVGFDHGRPLELPGASVALPIVAEFLNEAVGHNGRTGPWGSEGFVYPAGLEVVEIDSPSGLRAGWGCRGEPELFLEGTAPEMSCGGFRIDGRSLRSLLRRGGDEISRLISHLFEVQGGG